MFLAAFNIDIVFINIMLFDPYERPTTWICWNTHRLLGGNLYLYINKHFATTERGISFSLSINMVICNSRDISAEHHMVL